MSSSVEGMDLSVQRDIETLGGPSAVAELLLKQIRAQLKCSVNRALIVRSYALGMRSQEREVPKITDPSVPDAVLPEPAAMEEGAATIRKWSLETDDQGNPVAARVPTRWGEVTIPWSTYEWMVDAYSRWTGTGAPIAEIADKLHLTPRETRDVIRVLDLTHDSAPLTDLRIAEGNLELMAEEIASRKKAALYRKVQKRYWRTIEKDAERWKNFETLCETVIVDTMKDVRPKKFKFKPVKMGDADEKWALVVSLSDVHVDMYSDPAEVGSWRAGSIERITDDLNAALDDLFNRVAAWGRPEKVYLLNQGDWFHGDTANATTTRGTPVSIDGRPNERLEVGLELGVMSVEFARRLQVPVELVVIPGNHDRRTLLMAGYAWKAYFRYHEDVTVTVVRRPREYSVYGRTLFVWLHGDKINPNKLPSIIQSEARRQIGDTDYTLCFYGHLHHQISQTGEGEKNIRDEHGLVLAPATTKESVTMLEQQPSIASSDAYHTEHGYVGAERGVVGYMIHHERGRVGYVIGRPVRRAS